MEFLAQATACVFAAAFDKQFLDRSSVLFVAKNINQRIKKRIDVSQQL